ncbi:hypothetical protein D3C87_1801000 [compost metagenome]
MQDLVFGFALVECKVQSYAILEETHIRTQFECSTDLRFQVQVSQTIGLAVDLRATERRAGIVSLGKGKRIGVITYLREASAEFGK